MLIEASLSRLDLELSLGRDSYVAVLDSFERKFLGEGTSLQSNENDIKDVW